MTSFSRMVLVAAMIAMLPGCMTSKLLKLGEDDPASPPTVQPVAYTSAVREGRIASLRYNSTIDAQRNVSYIPTEVFQVDLAELSWQKTGRSPIDPACVATAWRARPQDETRQPLPLVVRLSDEVEGVVTTHTQHAEGIPPLSIQNLGIDAWIVCGSGDAIGYAKAPEPPPAYSGGRRGKYVAAIVLLFPFAVVVDIVSVPLFAILCADMFVRSGYSRYDC